MAAQDHPGLSAGKRKMPMGAATDSKSGPGRDPCQPFLLVQRDRVEPGLPPDTLANVSMA
jgi:hypothetical protein